jgi:peroxiredoxin
MNKPLSILTIWMLFFGLLLLIMPLALVSPDSGLTTFRSTSQSDVTNTRLTGVKTGCDLGNLAPEFTLKNVSGENVNLSDFRGKTVIVNFWATWCGPCQFEIPFLQSIYSNRQSKDVAVLGIDVQENVATVKNFVAGKEITYPVLLDLDTKVAQKYCLPNALPVTFFLNSDGVIKARKIGAFRNQAELESILDSVK